MIPKSIRSVLLIIPVVYVAMTISGQADVVSRWSFDGNLNDSAASGVNADNLVDNAGAVGFISGVVGQAVIIPDTISGSNKLTATTSADLNLPGSWTLEAFVWPDLGNDPGNEWERVWTKWGEGGNEWHTSIRGRAGESVPDGLDLFVNGSNNIINHNSSATVPRETWSHIAFVGNAGGNSITAWLNGVPVAMTSYVTINATAGNMNFGNFAAGNQSTLQFSGYIDEALIHNVAVDAAYLQGRAALIPEPSAAGLLALAGLATTLRRRRR